MDIPQFGWDVELLLVPDRSMDHTLQILTPSASLRRYSSRLLPYWYSYHLLLAAIAERHGSALDVLEVHPDLGQLKAYMNSRAGSHLTRRWDAAGPVLHKYALTSHGYGHCFETDTYGHVGHPPRRFQADSPYDVIFLLNSLEHQQHAASFLCMLADSLRPGGCIIGACRSQGRFGDRMTPRRLRRLAADCGLKPGLISGSVWGWRRGHLQKNQGWRLRTGLLLGALLPSLSREIYWILQLPAGQSPH